MTVKTFEKLYLDAQRQNAFEKNGRESLKWLSSEARKININSAQLIREAEKNELVNINQISLGKMYFFYYDPKHKLKLPYYDRFPCIFPVDKTEGGFYGLNLHYLPYVLRAKLMDSLYDLENNARLSKNKRLEINYGLLKGMGNMWKPCFKMYLNNHVKSRFFKIGYENWNSAAFLPVQSFEKASMTKIWQDSRNKIK